MRPERVFRRYLIKLNTDERIQISDDLFHCLWWEWFSRGLYNDYNVFFESEEDPVMRQWFDYLNDMRRHVRLVDTIRRNEDDAAEDEDETEMEEIEVDGLPPLPELGRGDTELDRSAIEIYDNILDEFHEPEVKGYNFD